ncbi:recombinase family protein [Teichococcus wenyumeiae]
MTMHSEATTSGIHVGYARVSTDDQRLELQTDALVKAGMLPSEIFTDKASGATTDRPGFIDCFRALREGDTLVVWKLDRLGRNLSQLLQTAERLEKKGVRLKVVTEAIDTSTPMGRFMFNVMGSFAQLEREMIQERTLAGLAAARERGRIGGRRPVMTPELLEQAQHLVLDEAAGGEGLSVAQAAKRLKISKTTLYRELSAAQAQEGANDLAA